MKYFLTAVAITAASIACNNNTAQTAVKMPAANTDYNDGFVSLFDGKSFTGWHTFKRDTVGSAWKVVDGMIYLDTSKKEGWQVKDGGDIVTDEAFENYHLKLEWKLAPGGNSGIIFNVQEDGNKFEHTWHTGPEMQVLDNAGHSDAKIYKHKSGDLYDLIASSKDASKPAGEWNLAEIICNKGKLDLFLNGVNVVSTTMWDDNWKQLIAGSKFKGRTDFGAYKKGRIALQDHGNAVWYRNIVIKKL